MNIIIGWNENFEYSIKPVSKDQINPEYIKYVETDIEKQSKILIADLNGKETIDDKEDEIDDDDLVIIESSFDNLIIIDANSDLN